MLSVHKYKAKLREVFGFADPEMVKRYAVARSEYKTGIQDGRFNPFTNDPNCKSCKKKKTSTDDSGDVSIQSFQGYSFVPKPISADEI